MKIISKYLLIALLLSLRAPISAETVWHTQEQEEQPLSPPLIWVGGALAACGTLFGGYQAGKAFTIPAKRGPEGATGPAGSTGAKGARGDSGNRGPSGEKGVSGPAGHQGAAGAQGERGSLTRTEDNLSFYFFNGSDQRDELLTAIVTTPESEQFTVDQIGQGTGLFAQPHPSCRAPAGVYYLTIIPQCQGSHIETEVTVMRNNEILALLPFPKGPYEPFKQMTVHYTHVSSLHQ